jgi:sugar phosphate isomerase/epimerase
MPSQIGAQLYTLRDFAKTPPDIARTFSRVKKMGYDAVQVSGMGPIDPAELAKMLKNEGLACAATHINIDRMEKEPEKVIEEHQMWNCHYTAIGGYWAPNNEWSAKAYLEFAQRYNAIAKKFAGSSVSIGYHNHSHELARFDGKTGLQILMDKFDKSVWMEIDTYWIAHGGGDPTAWINQCKGRIPCVHFKDMAIKPDRTQFMAEIGEGNLNWPAIIPACKDAGVQWYLIEQDICYRDPFESLKISLENMKKLGVN